MCKTIIIEKFPEFSLLCNFDLFEKNYTGPTNQFHGLALAGDQVVPHSLQI